MSSPSLGRPSVVVVAVVGKGGRWKGAQFEEAKGLNKLQTALDSSDDIFVRKASKSLRPRGTVMIKISQYDPSNDFQGASSAAVSSACAMHTCVQCGFMHANYSMFAHLYDEPGFPFAVHTDITLQRAIGMAEGRNVSANQFDQKPVMFCCINCCKAHGDRLEGKSYFREVDDGSKKPSSY